MDVEPQRGEVIKPAVLYHGSSVRGLEQLIPQRTSFRDSKEGPIVFATPRRDLATCFIVPADDSWTAIGIGSDGSCHMVISNKERFREVDKGGVIYELSGDGFESDLTQGLREVEWVSRRPVRVKSAVEYESSLEGMIKEGVGVYFVDKEIFKKFRKENGEGKELLLRGLRPEEIKR